MSWLWSKIKLIVTNITVEPLFLLYAMCIGFYAIAAQTLYIQVQRCSKIKPEDLTLSEIPPVTSSKTKK